MVELSTKILDLLKSENGMKAREIAKVLGMENKEVNHFLYGELCGKCYQDNNYIWHIKESDIPNQSKSSDDAISNGKLSKICRYYLNCLSLDDDNGVKAFASSQFNMDYIEIQKFDYSPIDDILHCEEVAGMISMIHTRRNMVAYFGYPVLIEKVFSRKTNQPYYFVNPVFLFEIEFSNKSHPERINVTPRINMNVIKKFSIAEKDSYIYELLQLENELGLNNLETEIEIDELVNRLMDIRPEWKWNENISPDQISFGIPISELTTPGIYNRAVFITSERSPYTKGLVKELNKLATISESEYKGTALYNWINGTETPIETDEDNELLEILPMNTEQEQAIKLSLSSNLTIITGPPGTGKSQVVTNMLMNAAWKKKNVIFTSKNNKAVDVVDLRVNAIGERPILLRLGNNTYANRMAEVIEAILSVSPNDSDQIDYEYYLKLYNDKIIEMKYWESEKSKVINLRNRVDELEKNIEKIRTELGDEFVTISEADLIKKTNVVNHFSTLFTGVQKSKQKFIIKLFWSSIKGARIKSFEESISSINDVLNSFGLDELSYQYDNSYVLSIQATLTKAQDIIYRRETALEYKDLLATLNKSVGIEIIDKSIYTVKQNLPEIVQKLWNKWLIVRQMNINKADREEMTSFLAIVKLTNGGEDREADNKYDMKFSKIVNNMRNKMTRYLPCWAVTSLSANGKLPFTPGVFDMVIIDEASQCDIASVIPLLYRAKNAVVIGDPKQLMHICGISNKQDKNLLMKYDIPFRWSYKANSLFDIAAGISKPEAIINLRDHHRSHADIINFSNNEFYEGRLRIATKYNKLKFPYKNSPGIRWVPVAGAASRPASGGAINKREASELISEIRHLVFENGYMGSIGVVTPFRAQANYIRDQISIDSKMMEKIYGKNDFLVDTVHKFQGDERDIMFFSPVISKGISNGAITFLKNTGNLFNVAITRARAMLVVVGDKSYAADCGIKYLENFAAYTDNLDKINTKPTSNLEYSGRTYPKVSNFEQVSDWEIKLYTALYDAGIFTIPQYPVEKYSLDLAMFDGDRRLDIEVDGERYHRDWDGELCYRDQLRNHRLYELGWDVRRFWVYQIRDDIDWCIGRIKEWKNDIVQD